MDIEKFNPSLVDQKWQKFWEEKKIFKCSKTKEKPKVLLFRNVSLPFRKNSHGSCQKLYSW